MLYSAFSEMNLGTSRLYPERPMVGVGVLIRRDGKYLIIRRAAEPDAGLWSVPGGLVDIGEKISDAAVREAKEETGLDVEIIDLLGVVDRIVREGSRIKYHFIIADYLAEPKEGTLKPASDALDARWVDPNELLNYDLTPTLIELLKRIKIYPEI